MKQLFILILLVFSLTACTNESENFVVEESGTNDPKIEETELQDENDAVEISNDEDVEPADQVEDPVLEENLSAAMIDLDVPFQSQAPHRNWGMPYQEACEEAIGRIIKNQNYKHMQIGYIAINKKGDHGSFAVHNGFNYALHQGGKNQMIDSPSFVKK